MWTSSFYEERKADSFPHYKRNIPRPFPPPHTHIYLNVYVWRTTGWKEMVPIFFLLLRHTAFAFDIDRYCGFWVLDGWFDQRSLHGQHAFRRKGRVHLLNISWRGEAAREEYDTIRSEIRRKKNNKTLLLSEKRISVLQFSQKRTGPKRLVKRIKLSSSLVCVTLWPLDGSRALWR